MKQCKCEHWQQCPVCMPHRFDAEGNLLPLTKVVGGYRIGNAPGSVWFQMTEKPSRFHRFAVWFVLGWKWVDL